MATMLVHVVNDHITIADQPTADELEGLPGEGYSGVVNLRMAGEPEQPLSPEDEGELVERLGLDYLHVPVGGGPLNRAGVADVIAFIEDAPGKVLVHCRRGPRAHVLVALQQAKAQGWPADQVVAEARKLGLVLDGNLRALVEHYLANHAS